MYLKNCTHYKIKKIKDDVFLKLTEPKDFLYNLSFLPVINRDRTYTPDICMHIGYFVSQKPRYELQLSGDGVIKQ